MNRWLTETELKGDAVTLVPLRLEHREGLLAAAADGDLAALWFTSVPGPASIDAFLAFALAEQEADRALPFAVIENASGQVVGSTRFMNATPAHRRVEIGHTWYAGRCQRSAVNSTCKLLLLTHAFETLDAIAVEFRTHWHNQASRQAIARLGAKQDGILRNHQIDAEGILRDTVVFSIIAGEWPAVKRALRFRIERRGEK